MKNQLLTCIGIIAIVATYHNDASAVLSNEVTKMASRLTQLHKDKGWLQVESLLKTLFAGDREFAACVISIPTQDPTIETRTHLIGDAARAGLKELAPTLILLLDDADNGVRGSSAIALGDLGDEQAIQPLEQLLARESDVLRKHRIRISLAKLGRPYLQYFISGLFGRDSMTVSL